MTLHEAIRILLEQVENREMTITELTVENERQSLYTKRNGEYPNRKQFAMRAMNYSEFEVVIRLRS